MSIECRKQKRKKKPMVITPTNQNKGKYYKKPFKTQSTNNETAQSAGKRGRPRSVWF